MPDDPFQGDGADPSADDVALLDGGSDRSEAEEILRAIAAGEVDAFVVTDSGPDGQVVTLSTADRPYRMFVENMRDGAATLSTDGDIIFANRRLAEMLGFPIEIIVGSPLAMLVAGGSVAMELLVAPGPDGATIELELVDGRGGTVPVLVGSSPLHVDGHHLTSLTFTDLRAQHSQDAVIARLRAAQAEQVADLHRARDALTRQASHDALTGLPNRALLVDRIDQALSRSRLDGSCTALLFLDLDRFKQVNDRNGHAAGDAVLQSVASRLLAVVRPLDTVARLGGDEFVVLAHDVEGVGHAVEIADRLLVALRCAPDSALDGETVTGSIGVCAITGGGGSAESLLHEADMAMYRAKALGGDRLEVFDAAMGDQASLRADARRVLDSALGEQRLIAHYQPIIDLGSRQLSGFEALARICFEDGTVSVPPEFIPAAEDSGLVVPLGARILRLACEEAAGWSPRGAGAPSVAVRLSGQQLEAGDLPRIVQDVLAATGLAAHRLHLELLETAVLDMYPHATDQLYRIRDLGVEIGLRNLGVGPATLTQLARLPLTFVKVGPAIVGGLVADEGDRRLVRAVIDLAASLELRSVAEGVETVDQLGCLDELGCIGGQGPLFSGPEPAEALGASMARSSW